MRRLAATNVSSRIHSCGLTVSVLEAASPQHTGTVMKLHVSPIYTMLPSIVQKWILTVGCFKFFRPSWRSRYLILLGSFLYKFANSDDRNAEPKGAPLHVEGIIDASLLGRNGDYDLGLAVLPNYLPSGYTAVVAVSTLRQRNYYAFASREDAAVWIQCLTEARHESVKRSMGHAPMDSYPPQWTYLDGLGQRLAQSKDRIRRRMEASNDRETAAGVELSSLTSRGYFG